MASKIKEDEYYTFKPFRVPKYKIAFERAGKLSDIQGYVWYTPAAIYLWGQYSEVNLADLVRQHNSKIFWYTFDKPIFSGFGHYGDAWNHTLWAASVEDWENIVNTVLETVQFDIPSKRLYQYALQKLKIYDPLSMDTRKVLTPATPCVDISAFAVLSNEKQFAFDVRKLDMRITPSMVCFKPSKIHMEAAVTLFKREGLTQDQAFESYKAILLSSQDSTYNKSITDLNASKRKT